MQLINVNKFILILIFVCLFSFKEQNIESVEIKFTPSNKIYSLYMLIPAIILLYTCLQCFNTGIDLMVVSQHWYRLDGRALKLWDNCVKN